MMTSGAIVSTTHHQKSARRLRSLRNSAAIMSQAAVTGPPSGRRELARAADGRFPGRRLRRRAGLACFARSCLCSQPRRDLEEAVLERDARRLEAVHLDASLDEQSVDLR